MSSPSAGRYEILEEIGRGAQSIAYRARDPRIDRIVAVKRLVKRPDLTPAMRDEFHARFLREAQAAGRLFHPNIAAIFDVGEEEGEPYIAMEYIDGENLDAVLARSAPLPVSHVVRIGIQLSSALEYAHRQGIVHRDIKPGNIMITREGTVKVVDFGIAKLGQSSLTQTGIVMGTPSYMAPEQILGQAVDHRSDIFSAGVVLYEALTGLRPFTGDNPTTIAYRIVHQPHPPVREIQPTASREIDGILSRALAKEPAHRYQSSAELGRDLSGLGTREPEETVMLTAEEAETQVLGPDDEATAPAGTPWRPPGQETAQGQGASRVRKDATTASLPRWEFDEEDPTLTDAGDVRREEGEETTTPEPGPKSPAWFPIPITPKTAIAASAAAAVLLILGIVAYFVFRSGEPAGGTVSEAPAPDAVALHDEAIRNALSAMSEERLVGDQQDDALHFVNLALAQNPLSPQALNLKNQIRREGALKARERARNLEGPEIVAVYEEHLRYFPDDGEILALRDAVREAVARRASAPPRAPPSRPQASGAGRETSPRTGASEDAAQRALAAGQSALSSGDLSEATRQLELAVRLDDRDGAAHFELARSHILANRPAEAVDHLRRAVDLEPANAEYRIQLALQLEKQKNYPDALAAVRKAIELGGSGAFSVPALEARARILTMRSQLLQHTPYDGQVRHDHLFGNCDGTLHVTDTHVRFAPTREKDHAFDGGLETLRSFDVRNDRLEIVLGNGKKYNFRLEKPEPLARIAEIISRYR